MSSEVEIMVEKDDDDIEVIGKSKNAIEKEMEMPKNLFTCLDLKIHSHRY